MKKELILLFTLFISFTSIAQWHQRSDIPGNTRHHPVTFVIDGKAYLLTGMDESDAVLDDFYEYDAGADEWTKKSDFPGRARGFAYGASMNGKGYIGFGLGLSPLTYFNDLWEYDPTNDTWTQLASCPGVGRRHPAFVAFDGKIYAGLGDGVVGTVGQNLKDWWIYDVATDSWKQGPDLDSIARHHPYYFHAGGQVYVGFGHSNLGIHKDFYKFNVSTEEWERMSNFPGEARVAGTQFSYDGKGYILAGDGSDHRNLTTGEFYEYDPSNDSWTQLTSHPDQGRWAPGSFVVGDTAYYVAGETGDPGVNQALHKDLWAFGLKRPIGIQEVSKSYQSFKVFPNPTTGIVNLPNWISQNRIEAMTLTDMTGRTEQISMAGRSIIDLSDKAAQFYLLTIQTEDGQMYRSRFLKQ